MRIFSLQLPALAFVWVACTADKTDTAGTVDLPEGQSEGDCSDNIDNDGDGSVDCGDDGCADACEDINDTATDTGNAGDTGTNQDTGSSDDTGDTEDTGGDPPIEERCNASFHAWEAQGVYDTFDGCENSIILGETRLGPNQNEVLSGYQANFSSFAPGLTNCGITIAQGGICGTGRYNRIGGGATGSWNVADCAGIGGVGSQHNPNFGNLLLEEIALLPDPEDPNSDQSFAHIKGKVVFASATGAWIAGSFDIERFILPVSVAETECADIYPTFTSISGQNHHNCAIDQAGHLNCWGSDSHGQISNMPSGSYLAVSAGYGHNCALGTSNMITCWGDDNNGQVSSAPSGPFEHVAAGGTFGCGIDFGGFINCWGATSEGLDSPPAGVFSTISAGYNHACGIDAFGAAHCWGNNDNGKSTPVPGEFTEIHAGSTHTCALDTSGEITCWGAGETDDNCDPSPGQFDDCGQSMPPTGPFTSLTTGLRHTCAIRPWGEMICWGFGDYGQTTPNPAGYQSVIGGSRHSCGLDITGGVQCWGDDAYGQRNAPN